MLIFGILLQVTISWNVMIKEEIKTSIHRKKIVQKVTIFIKNIRKVIYCTLKKDLYHKIIYRFQIIIIILVFTG